MDSSRPKPRTRHRSITIVDLPERFADKKTIRHHFAQFAHVSRVSVSPDFSTATVHFKTEEDARAAMVNGEIWCDELLTIVGGPSTKLDQRASFPENSKSYEDLDLELLEDDILTIDSPKDYDPKDFAIPLSKIHTHDDSREKRSRSQRKVMLEHLGAPKIKRSSLGLPDRSKIDPSDPSRNSVKELPPAKKRVLKRVGAFVKPSKVSKVKKSLSSSAKKTSPKSFKRMVAKTVKDKFTILNERDKWLKKLLSKSNVSKSSVLKGTCPDMCPEKERIMRDYRTLYSLYETNEDGMAYELAIKEYQRSSADQEEPLSHELRPGPVLTMTMSYLINNIISEIDNPNQKESLSEWFDFCWDRLRGIRKDITQQQLCDTSIVAIIEQCARFHIACYDRLFGLDAKIFDQKINRENIMNCLSSLNHLYDSLSGHAVCSNEAEFKAYQILLQLNSSDILWEFQNFPQHIQDSEDLKVAVKAHLLFSSRSYAQFFDLAERASYLNCCLLQTYFPLIRADTLSIILKAYSPPIKTFSLSSDFFKQSFRINHEELQYFCENYGIEFIAETNEISLSRDEIYLEDLVFIFKNSSSIVVNKRRPLSLAVVKNDVLPPYCQHEVHNSFDEEGKLKKFAFNAVDQEIKLKQDFNFSHRPVLDPTELNYDSDSDVQIISDEEGFENFSGNESPFSPDSVRETIDLDGDDAGMDSVDDGYYHVKSGTNLQDESLEVLEDARKRLLESLEKRKNFEDLMKKEKEWKEKEVGELRKMKILEDEKKRQEMTRVMEDMRQERLRKLESEKKLKEKQEEELRIRKQKQEIELKRMEEEVQRKIRDEKERMQKVQEEQRRLEEERLRKERMAAEQERLRQEELERQRKICEEEERQRRLREERRKILEEQERLQKIREEEERQEEEERKRKREEADRQRKLKEEIRRQCLLKEKEEELKVLKNYLGQRLKALSIKHYARTWKKKIEKIRQANLNFPAMVRLSVEENLALWGTVGNRISLPPVRAHERLGRLKSTSKVISKLNQSKLNVEYIGDILAERIVENNLKLSDSLIQFIFCKLVFAFPERNQLEEGTAKFLKQCLSSILLPQECRFSEGFSIITSHNIPVFTSVNIVEGLCDTISCHGMNGLIMFSKDENYVEIKTRVCKMLSSLHCSVPLPLIITSLEEEVDSPELEEFLNQLKQDKVLIHWEIHNWTNWTNFCKAFFSVASKHIIAAGNISVNNFCNVQKSLMDEFFSVLTSKGELSAPTNIVNRYNKFLVRLENYFTNFKYQDIPREFESLLVKSCHRTVHLEKPKVGNDSNCLRRFFDYLTLENFIGQIPKNVAHLLKMLKSHCNDNETLYSQIVRLLELSDDDDNNLKSLLKRVPWISIIETLAKEKLEMLKSQSNHVFVVYKMKELLELAQD